MRVHIVLELESEFGLTCVPHKLDLVLLLETSGGALKVARLECDAMEPEVQSIKID